MLRRSGSAGDGDGKEEGGKDAAVVTREEERMGTLLSLFLSSFVFFFSFYYDTWIRQIREASY